MDPSIKFPGISSVSDARIPDSVIIYRDVDVSTEDYAPNRPFKGLYIGATGGGSLTIAGLDGEEVTLTGLTPGCWPFAGVGIISATTDVGAIVALF